MSDQGEPVGLPGGAAGGGDAHEVGAGVDGVIEQAVPPRKRSRAPWIVAGVTILVIASAGAGFAVSAVIGGGGTQPEDVLPDTLVAYADVDLDPSAEQKLNVVRLLGRLPDVESDYGDDPDLRTVVVDALTEGTDLAGADVEDWVGDRLGVGIAYDDGLLPMMAIQVTDQAAAEDDLALVLAPEEYTFTEGYAVVAADPFDDFGDLGGLGDEVSDPPTATEVVAQGAAAPLADAPGFTEVFDHLDDGIVSFYVDGDAATSAADSLVQQLDPLGTLGADFSQAGWSGQTGAVLRAEPDALELAGWSTASPPTSGEPASLTTTLPDSTLAALEFTGGSSTVQENWDAAREAEGDVFAGVEAQLGLRLPDDLETLFGDDLVIAVDGDGLLTGIPGIGARSVTDPEAAADLAGRLDRALARLTGGFGITAQATPDGLVVASTSEYAATLAAGDGDLGDDPTFVTALPDAESATYLVWVDLSAVRAIAQLTEPDAAAAIEPLEAFGVTLAPDGDGTAVRARLVFGDSDGT